MRNHVPGDQRVRRAADDRVALAVEDVDDGRAGRRVLGELLARGEGEQDEPQVGAVVEGLAVDPAGTGGASAARSAKNRAGSDIGCTSAVNGTTGRPRKTVAPGGALVHDASRERVSGPPAAPWSTSSRAPPHATATSPPLRLRHDDGTTTTWSYRELDRRSRLAAWRLRSRGLQPGDRILTWSPSGPELAAVYFGAMRAGVIFVPLDLRMAPDADPPDRRPLGGAASS